MIYNKIASLEARLARLEKLASLKTAVFDPINQVENETIHDVIEGIESNRDGNFSVVSQKILRGGTVILEIESEDTEEEIFSYNLSSVIVKYTVKPIGDEMYSFDLVIGQGRKISDIKKSAYNFGLFILSKLGVGLR